MMWSHSPGVFAQVPFERLLSEIQPLITKNSSRESCVLISPGITRPYPLPQHPWNSSPLINWIKENIQVGLGISFDYCLVHLYADGNSTINWHNDKESLAEEIISVSFGAIRKFRFREIGQTKGWIAEYQLGHGDLFHMKRGCQAKYEHCVPKETTVSQPRINLTFRKVDPIVEFFKL